MQNVMSTGSSARSAVPAATTALDSMASLLTAGGLIVVATSAALLTWSRRTNGTLYYFRMVIERPRPSRDGPTAGTQAPPGLPQRGRSLSWETSPGGRSRRGRRRARGPGARIHDGATSYTQELAPNAHWPIAFPSASSAVTRRWTIVEFDDARGRGLAVSARLPDFSMTCPSRRPRLDTAGPRRRALSRSAQSPRPNECSGCRHCSPRAGTTIASVTLEDRRLPAATRSAPQT